MHADARKLLWDAGQAAARVARFTAGKNYADYETDEYLRSAVERQFEIVGEVLSQLRRILVWGVIEISLGPLRSALQKLMAQPVD
jgi:uncharacterized protein with HEPN domain